MLNYCAIDLGGEEMGILHPITHVMTRLTKQNIQIFLLLVDNIHHIKHMKMS